MSGLGSPPPHGDENRQGGMLATTFLVTVITSVVVALRMATRIWVVRSVGWDDYTILFATLGIILGTGLVVVQIHYGLGRHKYFLTKWQFIEFEKYSYGEWIQTFQTLMFTKISICCFLLRIPVEKRFIRPIQGTIVALVVSNVILTLLWILQCNPIARAWNKQTPGTCFTDAQLQRIIISQALISIISDFVLALFPIVLLWKVQINVRIKVGLCILMGLGLITAAFSIVRTILNWQNINSDPTWKSVDNWYWRSWEVCIGITAACIPALRPGYKTVTSSIASYRAHRFSRKASDVALVHTGIPLEAIGKQAPTPRSAAAQAASTEADRANTYGAGDESFAMNHLPGDKQTANQGTKKTTEMDISGAWPHGSQRSLELGDAEKGLGNREFL